jgi:glycosyltransferase involved in cell wall biosynthesis
MSVTVGIPVYNEEDLLEPNTMLLVDLLRRRYARFEILLGSNGSSDGTVEIGRRLARQIPEVKFSHIPERGVGKAFRRFIEEASYDKLVSLDMDLSIDLDFIDEAVRRLDQCDIVVGSKRTGKQRRSLFRRFGSGLFVVLASWTLGVEFVDYSIGAKGYSVPTVRRYVSLISDGSAYVLDLVFYVHRDGGRVIQVPVSCEDFRRSRFNLGREAIHKFSNLGRLWWKRNARVA